MVEFVGPVQPGSFQDRLDRSGVEVRAPFVQSPEGFNAAVEAFGEPIKALSLTAARRDAQRAMFQGAVSQQQTQQAQRSLSQAMGSGQSGGSDASDFILPGILIAGVGLALWTVMR